MLKPRIGVVYYTNEGKVMGTTRTVLKVNVKFKVVGIGPQRPETR